MAPLSYSIMAVYHLLLNPTIPKPNHYFFSSPPPPPPSPSPPLLLLLLLSSSTSSPLSSSSSSPLPAGVVIHYMLRQEPFTTMFVNLQGGRFDCPDRMFFDVRSTWEGCNKDRSDVKELIPEMFCCPEAFLNTNNLPLGEMQEDKGQVHHTTPS